MRQIPVPTAMSSRMADSASGVGPRTAEVTIEQLVNWFAAEAKSRGD